MPATFPSAPDAVRHTSDHGVATPALDRPRRRTELSATLVAELVAGLDRAAADPGVRAVVLTRTGRTLCSGADPPGQSAGPGEGPRPRSASAVFRCSWDSASVSPRTRSAASPYAAGSRAARIAAR